MGDSVDPLPGPELTDRSVFLERPAARIYLFVPYQPRVVWRWTTHGLRYHGETDRPVLELVGSDGDVRSVVLPDERVPIPEDERDAIDGARVGELGVPSFVRYEIDWDSATPKQ